MLVPGPIVVFPMIPEPDPRFQQRTPIPQIPDAANPAQNPKEVAGCMGKYVLHSKFSAGALEIYSEGRPYPSTRRPFLGLR